MMDSDLSSAIIQIQLHITYAHHNQDTLEFDLILTHLFKFLHQSTTIKSSPSNPSNMDAASSTAADLATSTYVSASSTAISDASIVASSFSWLSIKEVFLMVLLYMWYMFLFIACGVVIIGGIYLICMGVLLFFGYAAEYVPKMYEGSKKWRGKWFSGSKEGDVEAQNGSDEVVKSQGDEPKRTEAENGEEGEAKSNCATKTV